MFIAVNKIMAPAEHRQAVIEAFEKAAPEMKQFKGFLGLEMWTAEDNTLQAVSKWESKEAMEEYTNNSLFSRHHGGGASSGEPGRGGPVTTYYTASTVM